MNAFFSFYFFICEFSMNPLHSSTLYNLIFLSSISYMKFLFLKQGIQWKLASEKNDTHALRSAFSLRTCQFNGRGAGALDSEVTKEGRTSLLDKSFGKCIISMGLRLDI